MALTVETAQDGNRAVRFDLRGRQRRSFLVMAAFCLVLGPFLAAGIIGPKNHAPGTLVWFEAITLAFWLAAAYFVRVAFGWVVADSSGLRTSRAYRGRAVHWDDIESIRTRSYQGRVASISVIQVRTTGGQAFFLPAPRTTRPGDDCEFAEALDYLDDILADAR
jgi:Bacterial PH domain